MKQRILCYSELCMLGDPRFMAFDGNAWTLDQDAINRYYCDIANAGAQWQRLMPWSVWLPHPHGMKSQFSPYVLVGEKFNLGYFNDYYFPIVRKVIEIARKYDIRTVWCLADNCQFHRVQDRRWSPWVQNTNNVPTLYNKAAYPFFKKWIAKCYAEFSPFDPIWSWGNEMDNPKFLELAKATIYPMIKSRKFNPKNCTYGAIMPKAPYENGQYQPMFSATQEQLKADVDVVFGEPTKLAIWREVHGCGDAGYPSQPNMLHQAITWWAKYRLGTIRMFLSDDGVWGGDSKDDVEYYQGKEQRRPSAARWSQMIAITLGFSNDFVYEHLPKNPDLKVQLPVIRAMYKAMTGKDPAPKYIYEVPAPPPPVPPDPTPPPPPPPPQRPSRLCRILHWLFGKNSLAGKAIHWLFGEHSWWRKKW